LYDIESRFTIKNLKAVCTASGLAVSGTKGTLQLRLRSYFDMLAGKQDSLRFNIGKTAAEVERGSQYGQSRPIRYNLYTGSIVDFSRPNGFPSTASPSRTNNTWGMSPLYQNIRLPVYKKMPFYSLLTNVTQVYNIPGTQPIKRQQH
jgi:hypothetical protein